MNKMTELDEELLEDMYAWVDDIPLSRPKKDIRRDFADGVLVAEVIKHYFPKYVELHNYAPANKLDRKLANWNLLNRKVLKKKFGFELADDTIQNIATCKPWAVEQVLMFLRRKIDRTLFEHNREHENKEADLDNDQPEVDQDPASRASGVPFNSPYTSPQAYSPNSKKQTVSPGLTLKKKVGDMVPKLLVEEKEQELLVKEETLQILQAKVRRLEHLLHLKDIRIDDLTERCGRLEAQLRPTAQGNKLIKKR